MLATLAAMSEALFCYCLQIADREFLIQVAHDGIIYWDDYKMRHRLRGTSDQHLEIQVALGDERARERLITEMDEFTIAVPLPREMLLGKGQYYYAGFSLGSGKFEYSLATDPASNGGDYADVKLLSDLPTNGVMETHFSMLTGELGMGSDGFLEAAEGWTKTMGPWFIYMNSIPATITEPREAAQALFQDARAQADEMKKANKPRTNAPVVE